MINDELKRKAESGDAEALYEMAYIYYKEDDISNYIEYLKKADSEGNLNATVDLAAAYLNGDEIEKNIEEGISLMTKAAEANNGVAANNMAKIYKTGDGVERNIETSIMWAKRAAELGETSSIFSWGVDYFYGKEDLQEDKETAVQFFEIAANAGDTVAMMNLGVCYLNGYGVEIDKDKCIELYEKARLHGNTDALIKLGTAYDDGGFAERNYSKAFSYYSEAYENESPEGASFLAAMYEEGKGVETNLEKAFQLYDYAAQRENGKSMFKLGYFLYNGMGTEQNIPLAIDYFEKAKDAGFEHVIPVLSSIYSENQFIMLNPERAFAFNLEQAEKGDAEAQYQVHTAYYMGIGVEEDSVKSDEWFQKAVENGCPRALSEKGFLELFDSHVEKAVEYWEKASAGGNTKAMYELANLYLEGAEGISMDKERALALYRKAAELGNAEAESKLGSCYAVGDGVGQNDEEAVKWFALAADKGEVYAQKNLAICYRLGDGVAIDKREAEVWFLRASEQGNIQAKLCLAEMYDAGECGSVDYEKAEQFYKEVVESNDSEFYDVSRFKLAMLYVKLNDFETAFPLWVELANRDIHNAQYNLGLHYLNGWGTQADRGQAIYWWKRAAELGNEDARRDLAELLNSSRNSTANSQSSSNQGCYIATAVYGSYDCPEVWTLRRFRDNALRLTWYGRIFIKEYYKFSPKLIKWFGGYPWFNHFWRKYLNRMVMKLQKQGYESTPYRDK